MIERWTDDKLDNLAGLIAESHQRSDERLTRIEQAQAQATDERQELREVILSTLQVVAESAQRQDAQTQTQTEMLKSITEMQSEVRGLQVENRQILDHLFGNEA